MADMYGNTNVNSGLAQNSVVMMKPKSKWQTSVLNTQQPQDGGLTGGIDSNLINSGYDASNVAITGSTTATPPAAPAPVAGLAANSGTGWTNQQYVADQMQQADPNAGTPPTTPPAEQGWFDVAPGAQTSKFAGTMSGIGAGIQGLAALGSMYYAGKKNKLEKQAFELEKDKYARAVKADKADSANKQKFAANVGGGATYVGQ